MMKIKNILLLVLQFSVFSMYAQNLDQSPGGVRTDFQFFSDTIDLKVTDQIIVQRAEKKTYSDFNFGTGWGYGYQSIHLEFTTRKDLVVKNFEFKTGRNNSDRIEISFYDINNTLLASYTNDFTIVDSFNNPLIKDSPCFYSIDLIDIPIILLNNTARINLVKVKAGK